VPPLDYPSRPTLEARRRHVARVAASAVVGVTVAVNAGLLWGALTSGGPFVAMAVALVMGPVANGLILLVSLASLPAVRHASRTSVAAYGWSCLLAPLVAASVDYYVLVWMPLHGG
jgi:hypothetical protein